jgi:hypothetical protein
LRLLKKLQVLETTRNLVRYKIKRKRDYTAEGRRTKKKYSITSGCWKEWEWSICNKGASYFGMPFM